MEQNKPDAYLLEEIDINNKVVWSILSPFPPSELSWTKDLKSQKHNLRIIELYRNEKTVSMFFDIKKYDSKKLVESEVGL
jgi:hypothetical protein